MIANLLGSSESTKQVEVITSLSHMDEDNLEETFKEDTEEQLVVFGSENSQPNVDAPRVLSTVVSKDSYELSHSPCVGGDRAILSKPGRSKKTETESQEEQA